MVGARQARGAVRRTAAVITAATRPATLVGAGREVALCGFNLVTYPLGIRPGRPSWESDADRASLLARARLAVNPELAATPVILLHGYVHNRSAFLAMARALRRAGFRYVDGVNYNALTDGIPQSAARVGAEIERVLEATGAGRVIVIGHSMGGVVARYYVQELGGEDTVDTVVTLGSPHEGTLSSFLGIGPGAAQLRRGSPLLAQLRRSARPSDVRWLAYWADLDQLVLPVSSARLRHPALAAHNVRVANTGHLTLLSSPVVIRDVVAHLSDPTLHRPATDVASLPTPAQQQRRAPKPASTRDAAALSAGVE